MLSISFRWKQIFFKALERNKLLNSSEVRSYCMMFWGIQVVAVIYDGSNVGHYLDINYSVLARILRHSFNVWLNYNTFSLWFISKRLAKDSEVLFSINPSGMFRSACRYTKGLAAISFICYTLIKFKWDGHFQVKINQCPSSICQDDRCSNRIFLVVIEKKFCL